MVTVRYDDHNKRQSIVEGESDRLQMMQLKVVLFVSSVSTQPFSDCYTTADMPSGCISHEDAVACR